MAEHLFLTGGTGFIGSRLLRLWLERTEARITLLARPRSGRNNSEWLAALLDTMANESREALERRVHFVQGDLVAPHLGMDPKKRASVCGDVTHIVHAGAELRFYMPLHRARRTNTAGTVAVLELARQCPRLACFNYVGTAYVAGRNSGIIWEDARPNGVQHNNSYERSKYEAEILVREAMAELPVTVLRPSIVTCDLETGYTPSDSAFYRLLRGVANGSLEVLPGREDNLLDMVPLDYIAEAVFSISRRSDLAGSCFHLSAGIDNRVSLGTLRDLACSHFGRRSLEILPPDEFLLWMEKARKAAPRKKAFLKELELYIPYLSHHPVLDNTNTRSALERTGQRAPAVAEYFSRTAAYVNDTLGTAS